MLLSDVYFCSGGHFGGHPPSGIYSGTETPIFHERPGIHHWILCIWKQVKVEKKRELGVL